MTQADSIKAYVENLRQDLSYGVNAVWAIARQDARPRIEVILNEEPDLGKGDVPAVEVGGIMGAYISKKDEYSPMVWIVYMNTSTPASQYEPPEFDYVNIQEYPIHMTHDVARRVIVEYVGDWVEQAISDERQARQYEAEKELGIHD